MLTKHYERSLAFEMLRTSIASGFVVSTVLLLADCVFWHELPIWTPNEIMDRTLRRIFYGILVVFAFCLIEYKLIRRQC
jgi:hypothetical protein